jgi:hypothetical protein
MADTLGINLSVLLSLLIRYFIFGVLGRIFTLEELLKKYQKLQKDKNGRKTCKITFRIKEREFLKFNVLANQWLYLPGELTGILVELFTAGVISPDDIWNIQLPQEIMEQNIPA